MKCNDCTDTFCPYRTSDAEQNCYYENFAEDMKKETVLSNAENHDWGHVRIMAAISAMQGLIMRATGSQSVAFWKGDGVAETAVRFADALVEELKKEKKYDGEREQLNGIVQSVI